MGTPQPEHRRRRTRDATTTNALDPVAILRARQRVVAGLFGGSPSRRSPPRVGRYELHAMIGEGGYGTVFRGRDPRLRRNVAIKLVPLDPTAALLERDMLEEAQTMAMIRHPSLVDVYDVGRCDGSGLLGPDVRRCVYIVMELLEGITLREWVRAEPRSPREIFALYAQAGAGVYAAHRQGVIHLDLKPSNIMVEGTRACVLDFGIAQMLERAEEETTADRRRRLRSGMGTPSYMSPEQHDGTPVGPAADQFSFAVCLFEALYGRLPFTGDFVGLGVEKRKGPPLVPPLRGVSGRQRRALARALCPDPRRRFPTMKAFVDAIALRPHSRVITAVAGLGALSAAIWLAWPAPADPCAAIERRGRAQWSADTQSRVDAAISRHAPGSAGVTLREQLHRVVDERVATWIALRTAACRERNSGRIDASSTSRRQCLDDYYEQMSTVIDLLKDADAVVVENTARVVAALDGLEDCDQQDAPARPSWLTTRPSEGLAIDAMITRANARVEAGRLDDAHRLAREAAERARAAEALGLEAEASHLLCVTSESLGGLEPARDACEHALVVSEQAQRIDLSASARVELAYRLIDHDRELARHHAELAAASRRQRGDDPSLDARLDHVQAALRARQGEDGDPLARLERARQALASVYDPASRYVLMADVDIRDLLLRTGKLEPARALSSDIIERAESRFGPEALITAQMHDGLGRLCLAAGDMRCAQDALEHALALKERRSGPDAPVLLDTLQALASTYQRLERRDDALELFERIIAIAETEPERHAALAFAMRGKLELLRTPGDPEPCQQLEALLELLPSGSKGTTAVPIALAAATCWEQAGRFDPPCALYYGILDDRSVDALDIGTRELVLSRIARCDHARGSDPDAVAGLRAVWSDPDFSDDRRQRAMVAHALIVGLRTEEGAALVDRALRQSGRPGPFGRRERRALIRRVRAWLEPPPPG